MRRMLAAVPDDAVSPPAPEIVIEPELNDPEGPIPFTAFPGVPDVPMLITPAPLLLITIFAPPETVMGPELNEPAAPILLTALPVVEKYMMLAPVEIASPVPADNDIVPVLDANPDAD